MIKKIILSSSISRGVVRERLRPRSAAGASCPRHDRSGINHACAGAPKNPHAPWVLRRDITRAWARRVALRLGARRRMSHSKGARSSLRLGAKADIDLCAQGQQFRRQIARVSASTNQVQSNSNNLIGLIDAQNFSKETQISFS